MKNKASSSLFIWALVAGMLSQNLVIPVVSTTVEDQKNYYPPDPHAGTPPSGHGGSPHGGLFFSLFFIHIVPVSFSFVRTVI